MPNRAKDCAGTTSGLGEWCEDLALGGDRVKRKASLFTSQGGTMDLVNVRLLREGPFGQEALHFEGFKVFHAVEIIMVFATEFLRFI
jgi:hypothetical protein